MIDCEAMRDRMPDVAHGADVWTEPEAAHLESCADCAAEWRVVRSGLALGAGSAVDTDRVARLVLARLRTEPAAPSVVRRLPWRGGVIGLLAAAASVVLILSAPRTPAGAGASGADTADLGVASELQVLSDNELQAVLQSLGPAVDEIAPGAQPHLEDLTDSELKQLLHSMGGE